MISSSHDLEKISSGVFLNINARYNHVAQAGALRTILSLGLTLTIRECNPIMTRIVKKKKWCLRKRAPFLIHLKY